MPHTCRLFVDHPSKMRQHECTYSFPKLVLDDLIAGVILSSEFHLNFLKSFKKVTNSQLVMDWMQENESKYSLKRHTKITLTDIVVMMEEELTFIGDDDSVDVPTMKIAFILRVIESESRAFPGMLNVHGFFLFENLNSRTSNETNNLIQDNYFDVSKVLSITLFIQIEYKVVLFGTISAIEQKLFDQCVKLFDLWIDKVKKVEEQYNHRVRKGSVIDLMTPRVMDRRRMIPSDIIEIPNNKPCEIVTVDSHLLSEWSHYDLWSEPITQEQLQVHHLIQQTLKPFQTNQPTTTSTLMTWELKDMQFEFLKEQALAKQQEQASIKERDPTEESKWYAKCCCCLC